MCNGTDGIEYSCSFGHCCEDNTCCSYYYELWCKLLQIAGKFYIFSCWLPYVNIIFLVEVKITKHQAFATSECLDVHISVEASINLNPAQLFYKNLTRFLPAENFYEKPGVFLLSYVSFCHIIVQFPKLLLALRYSIYRYATVDLSTTLMRVSIICSLSAFALVKCFLM